MFVAIISVLAYHVFQKLISPNVNIWVSLIITYATSLVLCSLFLIFYYPNEGIFKAVREVNWASFALALAIIGIEAGYLLVYRSGWNISLASPVSNAVSMILLIPVGILLFREKVTAINALGVLLCIAGTILINIKK